MTDFLLELLSEEIPARMQGKASEQLGRLFSDQLSSAGLAAASIETYATPRRLALIARGLPTETAALREETKGPRTSAPPQALEGFLRKTGLTQDRLVEKGGVYFAILDKPGRATASVLAEAIPAIVRAFPWPKSMRWGAASTSTESLRWVRPLQGIVALFGKEIVECEVAGIRSGAATVGHRFHHPGIITIGSANDYVEKLRACHVVLDPAERRRIIAEGAAAAASAAGLSLVEDQGLLEENAGLTEWPVPLLGSFDPEFLQVPPEVIQLTMRTNQKYFALTQSSPAFAGEGDHAEHGGGAASEASSTLAPNFICTANIEAGDGGRAIVEGNRKVLAARLSDARFFWEQDLKIPLEDQAAKLSQIVFHEKLGTVADKVDRVAKLARWLVEEGVVGTLSPGGRGQGEGALSQSGPSAAEPPHPNPLPAGERERAELAQMAERAAKLCKADLVTQMVGEFPELQGLIGGYLARAQGEPQEVADAISDHYKPVGQGDEVPTAPVTVAVSLADRLHTLVSFYAANEKPTGSKDPFALRRAALAVISAITGNGLRLPLRRVLDRTIAVSGYLHGDQGYLDGAVDLGAKSYQENVVEGVLREAEKVAPGILDYESWPVGPPEADFGRLTFFDPSRVQSDLLDFFADRLKVQQREAGVRHDLIDAVFALGGEDDLVRLLARVRALQAFVETPEGADLLAGYKRAANILKKEGWGTQPSPVQGEGRLAEGERGEGTRGDGNMGETKESVRPERSRGAQTQTPSQRPSTQPVLSAAAGGVEGLGTNELGAEEPGGLEQGENKILAYTPEIEEAALIAALDSAEPRARAAVEAEDFEGAMAALASLRAPVDAFFDKVTVNDPDPAKRAARLDLLARMRAAVHQVADFSRIEG